MVRYKCDKCGYESDSPDDFIRVTMKSSDGMYKDVDLCKSCHDKLRLVRSEAQTVVDTEFMNGESDYVLFSWVLRADNDKRIIGLIESRSVDEAEAYLRDTYKYEVGRIDDIMLCIIKGFKCNGFSFIELYSYTSSGGTTY